MVAEKQIRFFEENGYLKYGKALEPSEVEAMRSGLDRIIQLELRESDASSPEFGYGHDRDGESPEGRPARAIHQYVNMWKRDPAYEAAIHHPVIAGAARGLLRTPETRLWHDQVISKPPKDNGHFRFHQDFYFWPLWPSKIVSCWLALDDATVENGCMHVIPKSHVDPRFTPDARAAEAAGKPVPDSNGTTNLPSSRDEVARLDASHGTPVELKAGECMFHHCLNFHATPANITDRQRRAFVMIFMAKGVQFNRKQSPGHVLVPTIEVEDGEPLVGSGFPVA